MRIDQIGLQLYTLRDFLKTHKELKSTLERVRRIGYQNVQVNDVASAIGADEVMLTCKEMG